MIAPARLLVCAAVCAASVVASASGQTTAAPADADAGEPTMSIEEYEPRSTLVVPRHPVTRAKYPFIDVHSHQWNVPTMDLVQLGADMDSLNMGAMVNLSGRRGEGDSHLHDSLARLDAELPGRVVTFTNIDLSDIDRPGWSERTANQVEADVARGCRGLKIYKNLGLTLVDSKGNRVPVDDARLDPVWSRCGKLGVPVLIHSGEPIAFWHPKDNPNERWLELKQKPSRYRDPETYPSWEQVMSEQFEMFRRHPETTFIAAHMAWLANDLDSLGRMLDALPNVYTEIGAVLYELGRQPRQAKRFLIEYQDRVMFGKDLWAPSEFPVYFRVLETEDEYFDYYRKRHAHWKMYGLGLPDVVLRKMYYGNALKVIPGFDAEAFPPVE